MSRPHASSSGATAGVPRLLEHCEALGRMTARRASARTRLEGELGCELARRLVGALGAHGGARHRAFVAL